MAENKIKSSTQAEFIDSREELEKLVRDFSRTISFYQLIGDDLMLVERKTKELFVEPGPFSNPVLASFVKFLRFFDKNYQINTDFLPI